jgi:uncharacterized protein (DUF362 family)
MTMPEWLTRRDLLKRALVAGAVLSGVAGWERLPAAVAAGAPTIAVAGKRDPAGLVRAAVGALGGIRRFVKRGARVVVQPNMAWDRTPEQAANTNPEVVAEVVRLCLAAGAREVKVIEHLQSTPEAVALKRNGIQAAAEAAGAQVIAASDVAGYDEVSLPHALRLKQAQVVRDMLHADTWINVPIAKLHHITGVTLACKNLMGSVWDREAWHQDDGLDQCIADFAAHFRPHLTILDAVRTLVSNGPEGPGRTETPGFVAAGTDPLTVDAFGATLLHQQPDQIGHLRLAAEVKVGEIRLDRVRVKHV